MATGPLGQGPEDAPIKNVSRRLLDRHRALQIGFTAYAQLSLPQVAEAFAHLGFPDYFRVELSWAKLLGVVLLLAPVPARLKEWAHAGFAITLGSALIAHFAVGDGPEAWGWAVATGVLWGVSYFLWRRAQAAPASAYMHLSPAALDAAIRLLDEPRRERGLGSIERQI